MDKYPKSVNLDCNASKLALSNISVIEAIQSSPSILSDLENRAYLMGDCGSCPGCACINADFQLLAVIEAPATVPILVTVGGIRLAT